MLYRFHELELRGQKVDTPRPTEIPRELAGESSVPLAPDRRRPVVSIDQDVDSEGKCQGRAERRAETAAAVARTHPPQVTMAATVAAGSK
jgi:hypothetical protein